MELVRFLHSKIHRATVTHSEPNYEGSILVPGNLLDAARMIPGEAVNVWDVTNGNRFETYLIRGDDEAANIGVFGAAAKLVWPGDIIIIAAFRLLSVEEAAGRRPHSVFVDAANKIVEVRGEQSPHLNAPIFLERRSRSEA